MGIYYKGKEFAVDHKGYLHNYLDFCEEWAAYIAKTVKVQNWNKTQLEIINLVRDYYIERGQIASLRFISTETKLNPSEILKMFPGGLMTIAKAAGLPRQCC